MNTPLPAGFELDSPALPAGFELDGVTTPPEGFQLDGVSVNARPRPKADAEGFYGNEQPNARAIGPLSWPMAVVEQSASETGNALLDLRYGLLNKGLQKIGLTGFPKERMEFGSPEYAQGRPTPYKPLFIPEQPIVTAQFANEATDPVERVIGKLLRGFTTPGSIVTLGAGKLLGMPKMVMGLFGGPMLENAPESTKQTASTAGDYFGTPPEQRTDAQKDAMIEAGLNEVVNKAMLGGIGYGLTRPGPLEPDVLPPLQEPPPFQPLNRRLADNTYIDVVDVTGQKLLTEGQKQIGFPSMAEALAKVGESLPKQEAGDAASLGAGAKMNPVEGQSSAPESKAPISEDGNVHGGAQANLPPELRAISEKNNAPDAWAEFRRQMEEQQRQSGSTKEQDIPIEDRGSAGGNLSSFGFLDPAFWKQQLGIASEAKTDAVQLYNRMRNKLGERSAGWEMLNTPEFKAFMVGTRTPSEVEKWVNENGPKAEIHAYGMEGKVSEAKKELDALIHDLDTHYRGWTADKRVEPRTPEESVKLSRYTELATKVANEPHDTSPRATSYYSTVSALPADKPMPEWTATKSGKNVQRVDVVIPTDKTKMSLEEWADKKGLVANNPDVQQLYKEQIQDYSTLGTAREPLWQPDNLHEKLPNTLGWSMIQYKTGPKGEKIAVGAELQTRIGQLLRKLKELEAKGDKRTPDETQEMNRIAAQTKSVRENPQMMALLRDHNRLILKAMIEQARKEGATHIMVSDAETAMMTEGHDLQRAGWAVKTADGKKYISDFDNKIDAEKFIAANQKGYDQPLVLSVKMPEQEPGMRLNYDTILPKIAEELTGSKGEKVSLGEHKNAIDKDTVILDESLESAMAKLNKDGWGVTSFEDIEVTYEGDKGSLNSAGVKYHRPTRSNLIFRNPDGTPKTDVSGMMYPITQAREHFTYTGKDVAPPKVEAQTPMVRAGQKVSPSTVTGKVPEKMSQLMRAYNLPEDASYAEVAKTHRERAKSLHPDRGGSADAMAHENAMFDAIEDKMVKQVVRGQREMEEGLVPAADKAIAELKDAIEAKRAGKVSEKYGPADAHTLERWQLALQNAVKPFKAKGITIKLGTPESGALNMTVVKDAVKMAGAPIKSAGQAVRWYSEPLVERLGRMGGPVSKMVSEAGGQIISRQKMYYGRLTPLIDPAKKAMGRPNAANMWMRKLHQYNDRAAVNNMFGQNEGTVPVNPAASRETALLNRANLAVGHLATLANPQFVPSNKLQRMLTSYGVDVVRRGAGPAWEAWTKGVADANGVTLASVQGFFRRWKAEMDEPTSDVAALNSINQDFTRFYPKSVTHIKPGMAWHEVIIADPFAYLEGSAQRTATAVAFREVFPAGSRMLQQTRKLVQAELKTDTQGTEFDNLIRALQGHPTDTFVSTITAPDTWAGGGMRMLSQVVGTPLKSLMLTGNAATNIGEVIVGGPAIFLGYRNALPAVLRLPYGYAQLELNGQVNRALQNYSYDPSSPLRSLTRAVSGGIRSITFQQALNELQEAHAAMSASVVTERILAHNFSPTEGENFVAAMRGMGMTEANARRALAGDRELLSQFERRAAASLTSGHVSMAERSRAGTSRAFNELFWFHSYPQMTLNQVRKVMENLAEDVQNGNTRQMAANSKLLGRLIAGRTMQGAITAGIYALVFGGLFGLAVKKKEAKDGLGKFLIDSYIGGLGGPAAIGKRLIEQGGDSKTLAANVAALSTPVSAASDLYDLSMGNGRYEGRRAFERVGMFIESKTPAAKMLQTGMALYGLSEGDPKLDASMKAFYRWRREQKGWKTSTSEGDLEEDKQFRAQMRRVVEKLQSGGDWQSELKKVSDTSRAGKSLFARTLLRDQNGKGLSEEDLGLLRKHIGDEAVNLLQARDSMIRQVARELGASEGDVSKVSSKPLGLAVDAMSQGKRIERIQDQLAPDVSEWLTKNKLHLTDISLSTKIAGRQSDLSVPEYTRLEGAAVQEYEQAIRRLMVSPGFQVAPVHEKQERLNKVLDLAEKRAKRMSR